MTVILNFLSKLGLSLQQWVFVSIAGIIGSLVVALKVEGSLLHKAQVQLLLQKFLTIDGTDDNTTKKAYTDYRQAVQAYKDAGGQL